MSAAVVSNLMRRKNLFSKEKLLKSHSKDCNNILCLKEGKNNRLHQEIQENRFSPARQFYVVNHSSEQHGTHKDANVLNQDTESNTSESSQK